MPQSFLSSILCALLLTVSGQVSGQDASGYTGPRSCALCHSQSSPHPAGDGQTLGSNPLVPTDFCTMDEFSVFLNHDRHSKAYASLTNSRSRDMTRILGYDVSAATECLSCHSNPHDPPEFRKFGVTCEACHGPGQNWVDPHYKPDWRKVSVEEKERLGLVDLRNPATKSRKCFSCHIGNLAEGKLLTHEMYAAGHPPLPGVELATFSERMPAHWRSLREKGAFRNRAEFVSASAARKKNPDYDDTTELSQSRIAVIGSVVALSEQLKLMADIAAAEDRTWPDFAAFDCQACHHELQNPGWRQQRRKAGQVPGRPVPPEWPAALVTLGFEQVTTVAEDGNAAKTEFDDRWNRLQTELNRQPFGRRTSLPGVIRGDAGIVVMLDQLADDLVGSEFDRRSVRELIAALTEIGKSEIPDYHSARQLMWTLRTMLLELQHDYPDFPGDTTDDQQNYRLYQDWLQQRLVKSDAMRTLFVDYPQLRPMGLDFPGAAVEHVGPENPSHLDRMADYNGQVFQQEFLRLVEQLELPTP